MNIHFQTREQYLFIHRNVKHLLLLWEKDHRKHLYLVTKEEGENLTLLDPGETYQEHVFDEILPVFFQVLHTESGTLATLLGATFLYHDQLVGMYYNPYHPSEDLYFFYILDQQINEIPDEEYARVTQTFTQEFPDYCK
ncbi:hypothetical protein J2Z48_001031 [Croceifilum oryzae]|uniref:Uncharacterized protein n=1 Tax=Croceifilum oryzae TaxID=1553429 RepID=A0AAJ1TED2_9BACL|nr:hypothetical protein [Croceifilum oryzae]MDQ0416859.1 hypothetical protein [Croceifilum oryzae]